MTDTDGATSADPDHAAPPRPPNSGPPPFCVLVGPDHAGKSTVLARLERTSPAWRFLSVDDDRLSPEHALISRLRRAAVTEVAAHPDAWSPEFFTTLVQTAVVHLRDELLRGAGSGRPAVIDSYYYKFLAKCRLAGAPDSPLFAWWRTFPRPQRVIYLDVPPETTWRRSGEGAGLNPLEHYGPRPEWDGFRRYQRDLAKLIRDEIQDLPVTVIEDGGRAEHTATAVREVLTRELG
ncbi:ATP-binding protein [Streptomyces monashensis]|uniref:ATP-binding protein n=1 Tax=Streptomyces monashensis TaxID=1678012 RepID=UPI001FE9075E|nr:ATP-binding protein [Streptomyces monashensis]